MNWNCTVVNSIFQKAKDKAVLLALSIGLALGVAGGLAINSDAGNTVDSSESKTANVTVHSAKTETSKDRESSKIGVWRRHPFLLSSSIFDPWMTTSDDFFAGFGPEIVGGYSGMRTLDKGNVIQVSADVPGIDAKDIDLTVTDGIVSIKAESKDETDSQSDASQQRSFRSFEQRIKLPCAVESDKAEAKLKNGVITITIPKSQLAQVPSKKIPVHIE